MSDDGIPMQVRGSRDFGSAADRRDPRTPERRAERQRAWMLDEQWRRLPWSAPINLTLLCMLWGTGAGSAMLAPALVLGLAGLTALLGLRTDAPAAPGRRAVLIWEAIASATAIGWMVHTGSGGGILLAAAAMLLSPLARGGFGAWLHLALLAGASIAPTAAHGPWALLALLFLVLLCAGATLRDTRDDAHRALLVMERDELNALCAQLGSAVRD